MTERQVSDPSLGYSHRLDGRTALVTGGSRGLGREIALGLALAGAHVIVASRKLPHCQAVAADINQRTGSEGSASARYLHVGHWEELDSFVEEICDTHGSVDILVNNAGMAPLYDRLSGVSKELFDKVLDVNLKGPFRLSVLLGERMVRAGSGSIINISSIAAINPTPVELPYAAAKAGLNTLTIGLAQALGPNVRVNCIMAGPFLTDITSAWDFEAFDAHAERSIPLQRAGQPHEIVGSLLYFASEMSSYTTGSILAVDGGSSHPAFSPAPS
jgi:NAD(P)-dependent dehydrogenase (short-subunit alcohol dehydrogenase family)